MGRRYGKGICPSMPPLCHWVAAGGDLALKAWNGKGGGLVTITSLCHHTR